MRESNRKKEDGSGGEKYFGNFRVLTSLETSSINQCFVKSKNFRLSNILVLENKLAKSHTYSYHSNREHSQVSKSP